MNPPNHSMDDGLETETVFSLEIIAELAGVSTQAVLHYQELALISPVADADGARFDVECLRQLRRIEHLRTEHEVNEGALGLILSLMDEVERLRQEVRRLKR